VIGIIVVLIGLIVLTITARARALSTKCQSNLHQISAAFFTYAGENRGIVPRSNVEYVPGGNPLFHRVNPNWVVAVGRVLRGRPLDTWEQLQTIQVLRCPVHARQDLSTSYNLNAFAFETAPDWRGSPPVKLSAIRATAELPWLLETPDAYVNQSLLGDTIELEHLHTVEFPEHLQSRISWTRHRSSSNVLFADGSVRGVAKDGLPLSRFDDGIRSRAW
jgi:prepilin-type processing-associated H-X9-DG protein